MRERESAHVNKCKTSHHHRVTSFTLRSEQPPLLLSCSPDPTPRIAATCYVTPPFGPAEARGCRSTAREAMRQRRLGGKSELSSWSCCLFSNLSSRGDTMGLVIFFSCFPRFFQEWGRLLSFWHGRFTSSSVIQCLLALFHKKSLGHFMQTHSMQLLIRETVRSFCKAICPTLVSKSTGTPMKNLM